MSLEGYCMDRDRGKAWTRIIREKQNNVKFLLGQINQGIRQAKTIKKRAKSLRTQLVPKEPHS